MDKPVNFDPQTRCGVVVGLVALAAILGGMYKEIDHDKVDRSYPEASQTPVGYRRVLRDTGGGSQGARYIDNLEQRADRQVD